MRLIQLKLAGFKSFVDPTVIPTPSQLVGVVGPNGCGKSNIIDAVRWVMGESRASELRGESMQDVIFNGSGQRKPAARASVELVFDNTEGRAAGQWSAFSEISVRRVLTRDGGSSYFINNQLVRRRDVYDIFLGTGLGARGYAIIGQGMINRLIEARPEELRVYLEEAAGVSRYKERRRETENRLRDTRDNLTRVEDIVSELTSQLEHLEAQAQVARHYHELQQDGERKQHLLWMLRERQAQQERHDRCAAIEQAQTQLEGALAALRAQEASLETRRQEHYAASDAVHAAQGKLFEAGAQVSRLEAEIRHMTDTRHRVQLRQQQLQEQRQQWQEQQQHCSDQMLDTEDERDIALGQYDEIQARIDVAQASLPELENQVRQAADERETARRKLVLLEQDAALAQQARRDTERQRQALDVRIDRLEQELRGIQPPDTQDLAQRQGGHLALMAQLDNAREQVLDLEQQLPALDAKRRDAQRQDHQASHDVAQLQARVAALESLQESVQKKSGLQPWLVRHGLGDAPALWQQLHIEPGWEVAVEALLADRMGARPVKGLNHMATLLQDSPPGRFSVYEPASTSPLACGPWEGLTPMAALLGSTDSGLASVLTAWLSHVYACPDIDEALALREQLPTGSCCVVPDGHIIDRHSVRFYAPDSDQAGLLERQAQIKNLKQDLKAHQLILQAAQQHAQQADDAYQAVAQALGPARTRMAELTDRSHTLQLELSRLQQLVQQADQQSARLRDELAGLAAEKEGLHETLEELEARCDVLDDSTERQKEHFEQLCDSGEALFQHAQAQRDIVGDLERQLRDAEYAQRTLNARIAELKRTWQLAADQEASATTELSALQGELFSLNEADTREGLQQALEHRADCEEALNNARIQHDTLSASLREADEQRLVVERSLEPLRSKITDLQLKEQASRLAVEQFSEQLDAHNADRPALQEMLATAPADWCKPAWLQAEVQKINRQVDALGAVNLAALDELKAARERQQFLDAQYDDLTAAIQTLEDAIRQIDHETRELLQGTFDAVNHHFGALFPTLFGGGQAYLTMTGDEILDAGVQVMAQPPGKRNSTIHLLSGGEKALTAIALVFALFKLNPAPFCLLDEVDAPLDDANTGRYAALVMAMSEQTQFLFISHNKIAMQMAKQLIGVTMQEQGVSRIVAVDMESALQMAEA